MLSSPGITEEKVLAPSIHL